jgi:membrane associated rhomboid family serine protease
MDSRAPRITTAVQWIIAANIAVYFVQLTLLTPADVQLALGFSQHNLGHQWWTIATYMFVHGGFWQLALNLYTMWLFGPRVEWQWGSREFVRYYLFCGLGGWFAHLAFVPGDTLLLGASAAVFGVMFAYASLWPDDQVLLFGVIPTTVRWLVVFVGAINLVGGISASEGTSGLPYLAHLGGGLVAGWLYLRATAAVSLGRLRQGVSPVQDEPDDMPPRAVPKAMPRSRARENIDDVVARSNAAVAEQAPRARTLRRGQPDATALDRVLDKISATGLESLTTDERRLLDDASRRLRDG